LACDFVICAAVVAVARAVGAFTFSDGEFIDWIVIARVSERYPAVGGFHNFFVSSQPVPRPASGFVLVSGAAMLAKRRRRELTSV
jgi:hypothetical protein